jgi:hypothetical protein
MDRILRKVSSTLARTVTVDEAGTDPNPDAVTVTITRGDGTALVTNATTTNGPNGGVTYTFTPVQIAQLDNLHLEWNFTLGGFVQTVTSEVEVVGGYHFSLAQLRAFAPLNDASRIRWRIARSSHAC